MKVQVLPRGITYEATEDFTDTIDDIAFVPQSGDWQSVGARYDGTTTGGEEYAVSLVDLGLANGLDANSLLDLSLTLNTQSQAGVVFDRYSAEDFKFVAIDAEADQIIIGHSTSRRGVVIDSVTSQTIHAGVDYDLSVSLKGRSVSIALNENVLEGYVFHGLVVDGDFGLLTFDATSSSTK